MAVIINSLGILLLLVFGRYTKSSEAAFCRVSKYRSIDGGCNNVRHTDWGAANTPFLRLLPPNYEDVEEDHPPARSVLEAVSGKTPPGRYPHVTAMLPIWAQMLRRDLAESTTGENGAMVNAATGFLDGSAIYGSSVEQENVLRAAKGQMNLQACKECMQLGSGYGALYSTLLLEHNRLVDHLARENPHWNADTLYQEAKRVVVAEIQHITYNEFLPMVLGDIVTSKWSLSPTRQGRYRGYSSSNTAGTYYSVATSALRILPTMVPPTLESRSEMFVNESRDVEGNLRGIVAMALSSPAQLASLSSSLDMAATIEETRKQRLPGYFDWTRFCASQSDIGEVNVSQPLSLSEEHQNFLLSLYKRVGHVDLLTGAILEHPRHGSLLGPTFTCLLAHQFATLKESDRFWYENDLPPATFTNEQLNEIRKVTLSGLLCANVPYLFGIQPRAFVNEDAYLIKQCFAVEDAVYRITRENPEKLNSLRNKQHQYPNSPVPCDHQPNFDLSSWRDRSGEIDTPEKMISMEMLKQAIRRAEDDVQRRQMTEYMLWSHERGVDPKSPVGIAAAFTKPNRQALILANNSFLLEFASKEIINSLTKLERSRRRRQIDAGDNIIGFTPDLPGKDFLTDLDVTSFLPASLHFKEECPGEEDGPCDPRTPYRTFSGHCNNLERPHLGKGLITFSRLLPSVYENGISSPRLTSVTGSPLPSPRLVSSMVHADVSHLHNRYTLMVMQFAQFVDHDITFTPGHRGFFESIPDCRSCDSPLTVHPECMPIPIPPGDPFYPQFNITTGERMCISFMRSLPGQQKLGPREHINQNTAYLDGSQIYGQTACMARTLRSFGGRLNVTIKHNGDKDLLPLSPVHPECRAPSGYCFIAGDGRASEQAGLTAMHTVYLREHNRVVLGLRAINPHWGDEKLFQTARRIVIASYQHVLFNEFLPRLLGWNAINLYGLKLQPQGYYKGYSSSCSPNVMTEFSSAAFRIGHSLLRPHIPRMSAAYQPIDPAILLRDVFFNPDIIHQRHIVDEIIRGLVSTPMEDMDQFITAEVTNHLFEDRRIPHSGMDLPAINIQRARDHGIPPYNEYRSLCNLKRAATWDDLSRELPPEVITRLRRIYRNVNDVDLFPGGLSERAVQGGLVGPTFACIIGLQFRQMRKCDRFWYENGDPIVRFTEPQLAEIRKATLAKTLCDNLDVEGDIQRSAFDQPTDFLNPRLPCHSLPSIDLNAWRENADHGCQIAGRLVPIGDSALPTPCTSCICTAEGPQCASLRVTDCTQLLREFGRDAILRDEVCAVQCSTLLLSTTGPALDALDGVLELTTRRSRSRDFLSASLLPPPRRSPGLRRPPLTNFKLTDIATAFLGG